MKKEELIKEFLEKPFVVDEAVNFEASGKNRYGTIISIDGIEAKVKSQGDVYKINLSDLIKNTDYVGYNPDINRCITNNLSFDNGGILHRLGLAYGYKKSEYDIDGVDVANYNFNPYVYDKDGNKKYYQRGLVWNIENKVLLISSILNGIDCGKILVRHRTFGELIKMKENGENELSFCDVVDGKQRLNALVDFINDVFPTEDGYYFSQFSEFAKRKFLNLKNFSYMELPEGVDDETVIQQFLLLNFEGVPQSREHLEYVKKIMK